MIHRLSARRLAQLAALLATVLLSAPGSACQTTTCAAPNAPPGCFRDAATLCWAAGEPLHWEQPCVSFSVQHDGAPALGLDYAATLGLVTRAFALWPTTSCSDGFPSISLASAGPLVCGQTEYHPKGPNANSVLLRADGWQHDPSALGLTTVTFDTETGKINDADMEINLTAFALDAEDVAYIVAHEAGHFLGLDHSLDQNALMYLNYSPFGRTTAPLLLPDDVASICATYPPSRTVAECDFEPDHGFSNECGGDVLGGCAVAGPHHSGPYWIAGLLLGAFRLRRRARVLPQRHPFKTTAMKRGW